MGRGMRLDGSSSGRSSGELGVGGEVIDWETRPGGMLVQKRTEEPGAVARATPPIKVRVAYGAAARYEVFISSQVTFGELKKLLHIETGLQPSDQRLFYKGKQRENGDYLDLSGVKNRSKIILEEDPSSQERRYIEMQRNAKIQSIQKAISDVSMEVGKLADQVTAIETSISNGTKVAEVQITTLVEMFMRQAVRLDSIPAEGETISQKNVQAKRVQKCVENLDVLMISNARVNPVVVTTKWETFEIPANSQWEFFD